MVQIKRLLIYGFFQLTSLTIMAQEEENLMRSSGKIYVVVSVLVTIFIGIIIYMIAIDKKITRLEDNKKREEEQGS